MNPDARKRKIFRYQKREEKAKKKKKDIDERKE